MVDWRSTGAEPQFVVPRHAPGACGDLEPVSAAPLRILIIDDSPDDRAEARRLLLTGSEQRYEFREAATGAAGIAAARADPPDCVILDFHLPDMDAMEVLASLTTADGVTLCPVLVLTGSIGAHSGAAVLRAGAQDYTGKGWMTSDSLTRSVENTRERHAIARESLLKDERLRLAVQSTGLGIFDWNIVTGVSHWSVALEAMFGLAPGTHPGTHDYFRSHVHPDDEARVFSAVERALAGTEPYFFDARTLRADGRTLWIEARGRVIFDVAGRPQRMLGTVLDVTKRRQYEHALMQAQKMEAIGLLAGGVAHDFNNLITIISGNAELLDEADPEHPRHDVALDIRDASERAARLTRQLLAFAGKQRLQPKEFSLNETVENMSRLLNGLIGSKKQLVLDLARDPCTVRADLSQIEQVIMNLTINANEATAPGGTVTLHTEPLATEVLLVVSDTGRGMDRATLARMFEPFFTTKPFGQGSGLGLSTVKGIVTQSGGTIHAESTPGRGTALTVRLPRA